MLDEIINDSVEPCPAQNEPLFDSSLDYDDLKNAHAQAIEKWKKFSPTEKEKYDGKMEKYLTAEKVRDPKDPLLVAAKNYSLVRNEVGARLRSSQNLQDLLRIDELYYDQSILELIENTENIDHIKDLYKSRKRMVGNSSNAGIKTEEAGKLKNCLRQGRELYIAGKNASLMVKPLNFFYSITAYAYAVIVLNNPIRYALDSIPGSHGINYLPIGIKTQFGGDQPRGTFSDLFSSFPTTFMKQGNFEIVQDNTDSILNFYKIKHTTTMGTLLSMIPEIREYFYLITKKKSRTHPLMISASTSTRQQKIEFQIGDGETQPARSDVEQAFGKFRIAERHGKTVVDVPVEQIFSVKSCIYVDVRGRFWYVENPFFPVILPELCVHFLLTNAFSNLMRYSPDRWGNMLMNEVHSGVSLVARKYLSAFENKFLTLMLRAVSNFFPYVDST